MQAFIVVLAALCSAEPKTGEETQVANGRWIELLSCAEQRSPECKARLQEATGDAGGPTTRRLASILIEEWDLPRSDLILARARRVFVPIPTPEEARAVLPAEIESVIVVVSGVVTPEGQVEDVVLLRPSKFEELDELVVAALRQARYRPAWGSSGFVSQRVELLYRLEPRTASALPMSTHALLPVSSSLAWRRDGHTITDFAAGCVFHPYPDGGRDFRCQVLEVYEDLPAVVLID